MARRNEYLDFLKGLLIMLVVIGHSIQLLAYRGPGFWSDPLFKTIYMFHMPLFMAISGYVSTPSLASIKPIPLIRAKAPSYLMPLFTWTALCLLVSGLHDNVVPTTKAVLGELVGRLWFLWAVFGALLLTSVVKLFGKFWSIASAALVAALIVVPDFSSIHLFKYTFPFFLLGHAVALKDNKPSSSLGIAILVGATGICSVMCFNLWSEETYIYISKMALVSENLPNIVLRYIAGVAGSIFALYIFYCAYRLVPARLKNAVNNAGSDSIYIYIVSSYIFMLVYNPVDKYFPRVTNSLVAAIIGLLAGVSVTYISWVIGKLISANPFAARLLFGKKAKPQSGQVEVTEAKLAR